MKLEHDLELAFVLEEVQEKELEVPEVDPEPDLDPELLEFEEEVNLSGPQALATRLVKEALPTWPILLLCFYVGFRLNNV